jgi:hypothetical protein
MPNLENKHNYSDFWRRIIKSSWRRTRWLTKHRNDLEMLACDLSIAQYAELYSSRVTKTNWTTGLGSLNGLSIANWAIKNKRFKFRTGRVYNPYAFCWLSGKSMFLKTAAVCWVSLESEDSETPGWSRVGPWSPFIKFYFNPEEYLIWILSNN